MRLWRRAPVNSPPGCSVCAEPICQRTLRAQTARSRSRLHPQIPSMFVITKNEANKCWLHFSWLRRRDLNPRPFATTFWSLTKRATKLRYASMKSTSLLYRLFAVCQAIFSPFGQKFFLSKQTFPSSHDRYPAGARPAAGRKQGKSGQKGRSKCLLLTRSRRGCTIIEKIKF